MSLSASTVKGRCRLGILAGLGIALVVLLARDAHADASEVKERLAKKACLSGDPAKGVGILAELFVETNDPVFVFNQGRCYEQNRRYEDAIARFQEYLRVAKRASKAERTDAEKHVASCRKSITENDGARADEPFNARAIRGLSKEERERAAKRACLTGDTMPGVAILTDLYLDMNDPTYIFNQGRCFEQNRRYEDAIARFREYLVKAKSLRVDERADTDRHIADCQSYLGGKVPPVPPGASVETPAASAPKPAAVETATVTSPAPEPAAMPAGAALRTAGWIGVGVGGAGLLAGVLLNLKVNSMKSDLENDYDPSVASDRKTYKTIAWSSYAAGTTCLVAGVVLTYLGRAKPNPSGVAVLPTVNTDLAGAVVTGAF